MHSITVSPALLCLSPMNWRKLHKLVVGLHLTSTSMCLAHYKHQINICHRQIFVADICKFLPDQHPFQLLGPNLSLGIQSSFTFRTRWVRLTSRSNLKQGHVIHVWHLAYFTHAFSWPKGECNFNQDDRHSIRRCQLEFGGEKKPLLSKTSSGCKNDTSLEMSGFSTSTMSVWERVQNKKKTEREKEREWEKEGGPDKIGWIPVFYHT